VNTTPQKSNNHSIVDLVENEGNKYPFSDNSRMMISMPNELQKDLKVVLSEGL
jgi:hypothetical protein